MSDLTLEIVYDAIWSIDSNDRDTWLQVGMALKAEFGENAFDVWDEWSSRSDSYNPKNALSVWKSFKPGGKVTMGSFIYLAQQGGFKFPRENLSPEELAKRKQEAEQRKQEQKIKQLANTKTEKENARRAALRAQKMWGKLNTQGQSKYLELKKIRSYGARFTPNGSAAIVLQDIKNTIHGLQFLLTNGDKRFWPKHTKKTGHFHQIGKAPTGAERIVICEGYATGASIHEATGITVFIAFDKGNLLPVAKVARKAYRECEILIAADDDYLTAKKTGANPGVDAAKKTAKHVRGTEIVPTFKNRNGEKWTDFNDLHVTEGLEAVAACFVLTDKSWQTHFLCQSNGDLKPDVNNIFLILENDERWRGVLRYDRFTYDVIKKKVPPFKYNASAGEWTEGDTTRLCIWCAQNYGFTPRENDAIRAVLVAAEMLSFHPVLDYLHELKWDGTPRLNTWLPDYLGTTKDDYSESLGIKWMVGTVARVHATPLKKIKMDNVLILESHQGAFKSSCIEVLAGSWSAETHFDLGSKDGYQQLRGVWVYEIAELDAFNKAESNKAKAFFSAREDNYRPSYGKKTEKFPRQCVFVGTTNQDQYLKDVTGNRRYWPIYCHKINLDGLREARDQLWAEALHWYRQGVPWWVLPDEVDLYYPQQEQRFNGDAWEDDIQEYLYNPENLQLNEITTGGILRDILGHSTPQIKPPEQTRVGLIMKRLDWQKKRVTKNGKQRWVYLRPEHEVVSHQTAVNSDDTPI